MSVFHHLNIMRKARKHGSLFPAVGQVVRSAPNGTSSAPTQGSWWRRLREESRWFRHTQHHIQLPQWPSVHILHLTDLHLRKNDDFLERMILELEGLTPDIVVLTGDIVTKGWERRAVERLLAILPDVPKFAILGNWEYWVAGDLTEWRTLLEQHHVQLLVDEWTTITHKGSEITIVGTDDHLAGNSNPSKLCAALPNQPTLCLTHSPAHFNSLCIQPIDLVLAGHAHGGQIRLPKLGALWVPRGTDQYIAGWFQQGPHHLFVSRGMGWSVAPLRWHCPPEIAHIWVNATQ